MPLQHPLNLLRIQLNLMIVSEVPLIMLNNKDPLKTNNTVNYSMFLTKQILSWLELVQKKQFKILDQVVAPKTHWMRKLKQKASNRTLSLTHF